MVQYKFSFDKNNISNGCQVLNHKSHKLEDAINIFHSGLQKMLSRWVGGLETPARSKASPDVAPRNFCAIPKDMVLAKLHNRIFPLTNFNLASHVPNFWELDFWMEFVGGRHHKGLSFWLSEQLHVQSESVSPVQPLSLHPASTNKNAARAFQWVPWQVEIGTQLQSAWPRDSQFSGNFEGRHHIHLTGKTLGSCRFSFKPRFFGHSEHTPKKRTPSVGFEEHVCSQGFCTAHQYGLWDASQDRDEGSQGCRNAAWIVRYCQSVNLKPVATPSQSMGQGCRQHIPRLPVEY